MAIWACDFRCFGPVRNGFTNPKSQPFDAQVRNENMQAGLLDHLRLVGHLNKLESNTQTGEVSHASANRNVTDVPPRGPGYSV